MEEGVEPDAQHIREFTIDGKTIGVVGLGRIGQEVALKAKYGFGMNVDYYSRTRKPELEEQHGYKFKPLDEVMKADIVSVHLPPDAPREMIGREQLGMIKDGAVLVNTSVGHVIDQNALFEELRAGRFYAFLDVYDGLPPRKQLELPNVLPTYRAGWYTRESIKRKGDTFINHLLRYVGTIKK